MGCNNQNKFKHSELKQLVNQSDKQELSNELGIVIGSHFNANFRKYYYKAPDKRDWYLNNFGFFISRFNEVCRFCDMNNSKRHITNSCDFFDELRDRISIKLGNILNKDITDLESEILLQYFCPDPGNNTKILEVLKEFAVALTIRSSQPE